MSRKFNTKKFIKDVLNDKYALVIGNEIILNTEIEPTGDVHQDQQRTAIQSAVEVLFYSSFAAPLVLIQFSFNTVKMMAGSRHTLSCCLCNSSFPPLVFLPQIEPISQILVLHGLAITLIFLRLQRLTPRLMAGKNL